MRPITNILLVLALICYVFLPFYNISLMGTVTGLGFTAGTISQFQSIVKVAIALIPFVACFGAITLNCLRRRWWVLGAIACILLWLWFCNYTGNYHDIGLQHAPEVTPDRLENFFSRIARLSDEHGVRIVLGMSGDSDALPEFITKYAI